MRYLLLFLALPLLLGASGGPQVLDDLGQRRFARGPWVSSYESGETFALACDMTSDTCSDGRKIATTRSTPVPCETSPGVWEMVGVDEGCYSVRGLESWAQNTSYLSYGAELNRSPWGSIRGGTLERVSDGWRVSNNPEQANSGWYYTGGTADEGTTYTVACRVRADVPTTVRLNPLSSEGSPCPLHTVTPEWTTVSCTRTAAGDESERAHIWPGVGQSGPASVIVAGCWLTKTDTPGRACWGGEAPVTCDADRHTISTEGWPTESGEITITFTPGVSDSSRYILDTRTAADGTGYGINLYLTTNNLLVAGLCAGSCSNRNTNALSWNSGANTVRFKWSPDEAKVWANGVEVLNWAPTVTVESHRPNAHLGRHASSAINYLNGSISSLRVRSFE